MKMSLPGLPPESQATVGNLVTTIQGRVVSLSTIPARADTTGRMRDAYQQIAVQMPTGSFAIDNYGAMQNLDYDEKYNFMVEVENDSYGKAKQPRLRLLFASPLVKTASAPAPTPKAT